MKQLFTMVLFLYLSQFSVLAQSEDKKLEISVGYSVDKIETERFKDFNSFAGIPASQIPINFQATPDELEKGFKDAFSGAKYLKGVNLNGSYYLRKNFAVVADFSFTTSKTNRRISNNPIFFEDTAQTRRSQFSLMGGVQWKYRKHKIEQTWG